MSEIAEVTFSLQDGETKIVSDIVFPAHPTPGEEIEYQHKVYTITQVSNPGSADDMKRVTAVLKGT